MRVWITRDEEPDGPLCSAVNSAGLVAVLEPVVYRRVIHDAADAIAQLGADDWLVLTSVYAVEAVAPDPARVPRVAAVGEATARAARARGFRVEWIGSGGAKALFEELSAKVRSGKVCYPRSNLTPPPEPWPGIELVSLVSYETVPRAFDASVIDRVEVIALASPSALDPILRRVHLDAPDSFFRPFASIGPTTSAALRRHGIEPWVEAPRRSFESLARAIVAKRSDNA